MRVRRDDGSYANFYIHRLVLETFVGPCPPGLQCCHNNGDARDNRVENLRWDTMKSNAADAHAHGAASRGSRHPGSKLTEADIPAIRRLLGQGVMQKDIGRRFGVGPKTISNIKLNKLWRHA